jgi:hypothetical protein
MLTLRLVVLRLPGSLSGERSRLRAGLCLLRHALLHLLSLCRVQRQLG